MPAEADRRASGAPIAAAARVLALDGPGNFRDLGGYPTRDGGKVRWGTVFRSDAPHRLSPADLRLIESLDLRIAYDLRTDEERQRTPSMLPDSVRRQVLPIGGGAAHTRANYGSLREHPENIPEDFLPRLYRALAEDAAPVFGQLLTSLAAPGSVPALIHCTAGKDRTGVAVALLLSVLDVDQTTILDDYVLSATHFTERSMARLAARIPDAADRERYRAVLGAPRHAMRELLSTLREQYGGVTEYLITAAGLESETIARLRSLLVVPTEPVSLG